MHGRSLAQVAAVRNHWLAVQNHFRWFRNKRARLHKLAKRPTSPRKCQLAACDLLSYICLRGRSSTLLAAVQNHLLAVQNHLRWFRTNRARLQQLARWPTTLFLYIGLHGRSLAQVVAFQNHWLAVQKHFRWFRFKHAHLHKLARRPTSPRKCHLTAGDLLSYICLHWRSFTLLTAGLEPFACGSEPFPWFQNQARTPPLASQVANYLFPVHWLAWSRLGLKWWRFRSTGLRFRTISDGSEPSAHACTS